MRYRYRGRHRAGKKPWQVTDWETRGTWLTSKLYWRGLHSFTATAEWKIR